MVSWEITIVFEMYRLTQLTSCFSLFFILICSFLSEAQGTLGNVSLTHIPSLSPPQVYWVGVEFWSKLLKKPPKVYRIPVENWANFVMCFLLNILNSRWKACEIPVCLFHFAGSGKVTVTLGSASLVGRLHRCASSTAATCKHQACRGDPAGHGDMVASDGCPG